MLAYVQRLGLQTKVSVRTTRFCSLYLGSGELRAQGNGKNKELKTCPPENADREPGRKIKLSEEQKSFWR